jgi:membrane associated rhomboid family serine protease
MTPAPVGLRCPEHSGKAQGIRRVAQVAEKAATGVGSRRLNAITMALIAINVGVYLAELLLGGAINGTGNWIYDHGVLFGPYVANGDWWRLLTAAFLHYGPIHLAMNMYGLYLAGSLLEQVIGRWRFLLLYLASGLAGSAGALIASYYAGTVGASGAIFGIFGALFVLERRRHIATGGQIGGLIVLNLLFTLLVPGISIGGHIGGLIGGVVLMILLLEFRRSTLLSVAASLGVIALSVLVAYAKTHGHI